MPRTLVPGQFMIKTGSDRIPGGEALKMFRYNAALCKIEVDDVGYLHITQEGKSPFSVGPKFWEEVEVLEEEGLSPEQLLFRSESGFLPGSDFLNLWGFQPGRCTIQSLANGVLLIIQKDPWKVYSAEPGDWVKVSA